MSAFWNREASKSAGLQAMVPGSPYFGCMTLKSTFYDITKKTANRDNSLPKEDIDGKQTDDLKNSV